MREINRQRRRPVWSLGVVVGARSSGERKPEDCSTAHGNVKAERRPLRVPCRCKDGARIGNAE